MNIFLLSQTSLRLIDRESMELSEATTLEKAWDLFALGYPYFW